MKTCIYLRKSRADEEFEKLGQGNTLSRHRETLLKLSSELKLDIIKIHEEIVSGESLNQRPAMLQLLAEVSSNDYDAVLVMDMDRLGRGNMQEQGLILDTFKQSKTKIITPRKTYDLDDEFDEEYSEFEAFMARKELKIITRRMQRGRQKSVEEGNYLGTYAPFGYKLEGQGRNRKLVVDPTSASIVKMIFEMYANGKGGGHIAARLNNLGYKTSTGRTFYGHSIINIIKNPVYIGKLTWKKKTTQKGDLNKRRTVKLKPRNEWDLYDGKHESIIDEELYNLAFSQLVEKTHPATNTKLVNPLAGIIICSGCGFQMIQRPYTGNRKPQIMCTRCKANKASNSALIEKDLLDKLESLLLQYEYEATTESTTDNDNEIINTSIKNMHSELLKLEKQKSNLHDLLEQGVYSVDVFLDRSETISNNINELSQKVKELQDELLSKKAPAEVMMPKIRTVLDAYRISDNVELKNQLLKTIIKSAVYTRDKANKDKTFSLLLNLKI